MGRAAYPGASQLLIATDDGGCGDSNGSRLRLWKTELAAFAAESGLQITVAHFQPGTSKWNPIEHRLFSAITMNWRVRPVTSHEVVVETIAATTNKTRPERPGHTRHTNTYQKGIKISDQELKISESAHLGATPSPASGATRSAPIPTQQPPTSTTHPDDRT